MANSIRNPPQIDLDRTNRCPLCQSHVNYDQTIHEFSNKVVSRVQLHSQPNTLPRKPLNYAILRLHQEAVWMKLALYENAPQSKIPKRIQFSDYRYPHRHWSCSFSNQRRYYNPLEMNSPQEHALTRHQSED